MVERETSRPTGVEAARKLDGDETSSSHVSIAVTDDQSNPLALDYTNHGRAAMLDVDGSRPAARWVVSLPAEWMTATQRLLLLTLALDTFDTEPPFTCRPSTRQLQAWCGLYKGTLTDAIDRLASPDPTRSRPPLIAVEKGRGRRRSSYTLLVGIDPSRSASSDHYEPLRSGTRDRNSASGLTHETTVPGSGLRRGRDSALSSRGTARSGPTSGLTDETTPTPCFPVTRSTRAHAQANDQPGPDRWDGREIGLNKVGRTVNDEAERRALIAEWQGHYSLEDATALVDATLNDPDTKHPAGRLRQDSYREPLLTAIQRRRAVAAKVDTQRGRIALLEPAVRAAAYDRARTVHADDDFTESHPRFLATVLDEAAHDDDLRRANADDSRAAAYNETGEPAAG